MSVTNRSSAPRSWMRGALALALAACGHAADRIEAPSGDPIAATLEGLGVDTTATARLDDRGDALPDGYAPLGSNRDFAASRELLVLGMPLHASSGFDSRLTLVEQVPDGLDPSGRQIYDTEVLFAPARADTPWAAAGVDGTLRAAARADLDRDGLEELAIVYWDAGAGALVQINVLEDAAVALFVAGDAGDDAAGNGTIDRPFASIGRALAEVTDAQQDLYVMARAEGGRYDETGAALVIPAGTSMYGGYDAGWRRDVATRKTGVDTDHRGLRITGALDFDTWISGLELVTADAPGAGDDVTGIAAAGGAATLYLHDNAISGPSLLRNTVSAGTGGDGGSSPSSTGEGGWSFAVFDADTGDGVGPVLIDNDLTAGTPGAGGQAGRNNF